MKDAEDTGTTITPYEQLEARRNETLKNACEVINGKDKVIPQVEYQANQDKLKGINSKFSKGEFEDFDKKLGEAIQIFNEMKDNKIGIVWHKLPQTNKNDPQDLIRDARNVTKSEQKLHEDAGEKYGMQILNSIRGAIDLLDDDNVKTSLENKQDKEIAKKYLQKLAMEVIDKGIRTPQELKKNIKDYNSKIVFALNDAGIGKSEKETSKMLQFAREAAGLKNEHYNISTLITQTDSWGEKRTAIQADVMLPSLTEKLQQEYLAIANVNKRNLHNNDLLKKLPKWFQQLKPHEQRIIHAHAANIANGKRVISSQFLKKFPGLRNAYQKSLTIVKDQRQEDFLKIIALTEDDIFKANDNPDLEAGKKYDNLPEWFKKLEWAEQSPILNEAKKLAINKEERSVDFLKKLEEKRQNYEDFQNILKDNDKPDWFQKLDETEKDAILTDAKEINNKTKVGLTTKFSNEIQEHRQQYEATNNIDKTKEITTENLKTSLCNLHCGTPATKIKIDNDKQAQIDIVKENLKQLQMFQPPGETINLNILNTNIGSESFIFKQLKEAVKDLNVDKKAFTITNPAINAARFLKKNKTPDFKSTIETIGKEIASDQRLSDVSSYLQYGKNKSEALDQIKELAETNPEYANDLKIAVQARELIDAHNINRKHKHVNLELSAKMSYLSNATRNKGKEISKAAEGVIKHIVDFCKSGKDRTGANKAETDRNALANDLDVDLDSKTAQDNFFSQVAGNHEQSMAGSQGGMEGNHSIKDKHNVAGFIKDNDKIKKTFAQKSAHYNSKIKYHQTPSRKNIYRPIKYTIDLIRTTIKRYKLKNEYAAKKEKLIKETIEREKQAKIEAQSAKADAQRAKAEELINKSKGVAAEIEHKLDKGIYDKKDKQQEKREGIEEKLKDKTYDKKEQESQKLRENNKSGLLTPPDTPNLQQNKGRGGGRGH